MSDSAIPLFRRINQTPLRDLLRCRLTGRLDWRSRLATAGLPAPAAELIARVVKRTRLLRLEKAAVADELLAHYLDGLASGSNAAELVERFGDERVAARLIRRAKRRGRSLPLRAVSVGIRVMAILLGIYAILLIRFCIGRPTPSVDYLALQNEPIIQTRPADRAWPIWRQAILATSDGTKDGQLTFPEAIAPTREKRPWAETVKWLEGHATAIELARQAGQKPALGFILGPGGSADDPQVFPSSAGRQVAGQSLVNVLLPHLNDMRVMALLLSLDAQHAAEKGDGATVEADIMSLLGLARQLRESDGTLITQLVALSTNDLAVGRLRSILFNKAGSLADDQLIGLAHAVSGPSVAADLISLKTERYFFADSVQRVYTDNGRGDGRLTLGGLRSPLMSTIAPYSEPFDAADFAFASTLPMLAASRAELMAKYDRLMDQQEANFRLPIRQVELEKIESQLIALRTSPLGLARYLILVRLMPGFSRAQSSCERYLGGRDGVVVGIALELYHRRHGQYPASLSELTPELLPAIPADRITGDPVKYRLIDGKPLVYSVGADRVDDGGQRPERKGRLSRCSPASWGEDAAAIPHGDWLLFAPEPPDGDDD